jgi:hypothetical protein
MRYLIEIYVTVWEWIQDARGTAAARSQQEKKEQKPILTFLSQGAAGGAIGYYLTLLCWLGIHPSGWTLVYLVLLPIFLFPGAVLGAVIGAFIWCVSMLLNRRLGFVARAFIVVSVTTLQGILLSYFLDLSPIEQPPLALALGLAGVFELPIVLMTGSSIRPCHLLWLGSGPRSTRDNIGSWIAYPAGFLLRVVSAIGIFEALMMLVWISVAPAQWLELSTTMYVAAIVMAAFYFPTSLFFSLKTPGKGLLLPTVIFLNVPMAAWVIRLTNIATEMSTFLAYVFLAVICLWAAYTLACLIAPAPPQPAIKSWRETMYTRIFPINDDCRVQR